MKTFEEFKKQEEVFGPVDTPEKLARCEESYNNYLRDLEDENYFELADVISNSGIPFIVEYYQNLRTIFKLDEIQAGQICFFVIPSFEKEYLLLIEKDTEKYILKRTTGLQHYWHLFSSNQAVKTVDTITATQYLPLPFGDELVALLTEALQNARESAGRRLILDGVKYYLLSRQNGQLTIVSKHSPSPGSHAGKIVEIMEGLATYAGAPDSAMFRDLQQKLSALKK